MQLGNWLLNTLTSRVSFLPDWSVFFPRDYWTRRMPQKTRNWPPKASVGNTISFLEFSLLAVQAWRNERLWAVQLHARIWLAIKTTKMSDSTEPVVCQLGIRNPIGIPIFSDLQTELFRAARFQTAGQEVQRLWYEVKKWIEVYFFLFVRSIFLIFYLVLLQRRSSRIGHKDTGINAHTVL